MSPKKLKWAKKAEMDQKPNFSQMLKFAKPKSPANISYFFFSFFSFFLVNSQKIIKFAANMCPTIAR